MEKTGKSAIELSEEALFLLRNAPASFWLCYYAGTVPFILALLYFFADMSRGAFAEQRLASGSLSVLAAFLWMKVWQYLAFARLRGFLSGVDEKVENLGRVILSQLSLHPWGLILLPFSLILTVPLGWVYAYYQNLTVAGIFDKDKVANAHAHAYAQALRWPGQNHYLLLLLSGVGVVVFINIVIILVSIPQFLTRFLGIKEIFQASGWALLNTTFLAVAVAVTHLILDPFTKCCYFLRTFYGESRLTGEDLRLDLTRAKRFRAATRAMMGALMLLLFCPFPARAATEPPPPPRPASLIQEAELDAQISEVLQKREYNWRLPRERAELSNEKTWIGNMLQSFAEWLAQKLRWLFHKIGGLVEWIFSKLSFGPPKRSAGDNSFWMALPELFTKLLLGLLCLGLIYFLVKYSGRLKRRKTTQAEKVVVVPNLMDENLVADQLPEDEWIKLAREMMDSGNLRLAIRALFLGGLAALAQKQWISLARFKSNRDYERELRRRAANIPQLYSAFAQSVSIYDQVWYGMYEPTPELYRQFQHQVEQFKAC